MGCGSIGGRGWIGGAPASPVILTPPACQVPLISGLPSAVRGIGWWVTDFAVLLSLFVLPGTCAAASEAKDMSAIGSAAAVKMGVTAEVFKEVSFFLRPDSSSSAFRAEELL